MMNTNGLNLMVYAGSIGAKRHYKRARRENIGRMTLATMWRPPRPGVQWALDNGAYGAWLNDEPFPEQEFLHAIDKIPDDHPPDFVVLPDKVGQGTRSLAFSLDWRDRLPDHLTYYLAVQNGMMWTHVLPHIHRIDGLFVGGRIRWKLRTAPEWCRLAHQHELRCHIGRAGTLQRILWAQRIGADSIDSSSWPQNDSFHILDAARAQAQLEVDAV